MAIHSPRNMLDSWVEDLVRSTKAAVVTSGMITDDPAKTAVDAGSSVTANSSSAASSAAPAAASLDDLLPSFVPRLSASLMPRAPLNGSGAGWPAFPGV